MSGVSYLGSKSLGALNPMFASVSTGALSNFLNSLQSQFDSLSAQSQHYLKLAALPDPTTMAAQLAAALASIGSQLSAIALQAIPSIGTAQLEFAAQLGLIGAQLLSVKTLMADINAQLSLGGVHAFSVDGSTPATLGNELTTLIGGGMPGGGLPTARLGGVILLSESPASLTGMTKLFGI